MFLLVLLSSIPAGLIATAVMLAALYLPRAWDGETFEVVQAIGSAITGKLNRRASYLGSVLYFGGGVIFAVFYGWIVGMLMGSANGIQAPQILLETGLPTEVNVFFPLLGAILGLAHGGVISLFATILIIEHHPLEEFRTRYTLITSQIFSHIVYGAVVMFFHHQFLQLLWMASDAG